MFLEEPDIETLIKLLNVIQQTRRRRALCQNIGIDPSQLDFIENTSEKDFCIILINFLNQTDNKIALCRLCCNELTPVFSNNNSLKEIIEKLECPPIDTSVYSIDILNRKRKITIYSTTFGIVLTVLIAVLFVINKKNLSCASSPHTLSQESVSIPIEIVNLFNGECVDQYPIIEAKVTVKEAEKLWVVVKPEINSVYYVQAPIDIINGKFTAEIYIGEQNTAPGTKFKIRAFIEPYNQLQEGDELPTWPKAKWSSTIISVTRK